MLHRWAKNLEEGQLLTPGDEPVFPYADAAALHTSKTLVIVPKDKGGDVSYELYTLDYSTHVLQTITGPIGPIFSSFLISGDEWIVLGHVRQTVYAKSV